MAEYKLSPHFGTDGLSLTKMRIKSCAMLTRLVLLPPLFLSFLLFLLVFDVSGVGLTQLQSNVNDAHSRQEIKEYKHRAGPPARA